MSENKDSPTGETVEEESTINKESESEYAVENAFESQTAIVLESDDPWYTGASAMMDSGGPVVSLLTVLSVVALTIILSKIIQFLRTSIWSRKASSDALKQWQQGDADRAISIAQGSRNPTAQALSRAMRGRLTQIPEHIIREEVMRYGSDALFQLRRGFRPLEVIGSIAPLLGLLGTVLGMIEAFQQLEEAGNKVNPAILSGGIWEALLTTAVGLCVAIPVVAVLNWLERCVDHVAHDMENMVTQVFTKDLSVSSITGVIGKPNAVNTNGGRNVTTDTLESGYATGTR